MQWFSKLGNMLDEVDGGAVEEAGGSQPSNSSRSVQSGAIEEADPDSPGGRKALGSALVGKGLGFLSGAANAASTAMEKANEAVEKAGSAVDSLGATASSRLATALADLGEDEDGTSGLPPILAETEPLAAVVAAESMAVAAEIGWAPADSGAAEATEAHTEVAQASTVEAPEIGWAPADTASAAVADSEESQIAPSSMGDSWHIEDPPALSSVGSLPSMSGIRSPTPSLGAESITTSGAGTSVHVRVAEMPNLPPAMDSMTHMEDTPALSSVGSSPSRSGLRSPTASLGAESITTSGAGTSAYVRVAEMPNRPPTMESMATVCSAAAQAEAAPVLTLSCAVSSSNSAGSQLEVSSPYPTTPSEAAGGEPEGMFSPHSGRDRQAANAELQRQLQELRAEAANTAEAAEAQLKAAMQQFERLQAHLDEVEADSLWKSAELKRLREQEAAAQLAEEESDTKLKEMSGRFASAEEARQSLLKEFDELKKEVELSQRKAQAQAKAAGAAVIDEVREEMEKELQKMLRMKDEQVRALERKAVEAERLQREQQRELDKKERELQAAQSEAEELRKAGEGQAGDYRRELDDLTSEHQQQVTELSQKKGDEERMKHELALCMRGVEERARGEINQLEAQRAQLELHVASLQDQLEAEKQKSTELAISLGEVSQVAAGSDFLADESQAAVEEEVRSLRDRLHLTEERLSDARSAKEVMVEEMETLRSEFKALHVERSSLEGELRSAQLTAREVQATLRAKDSREDKETSQQAMAQAMQKDLDERMERHRDEVGYLRKKCDEKERRCEQLLAERSTLASELKAFRDVQGEAWSSGRDVEAGKPRHPSAPSTGKSSTTRSLTLSAPDWLRSADEPLRMVVRVLASTPPARIIFFAYVILLHVWVLFVLQSAAMQGAGPDNVIATATLASSSLTPAIARSATAGATGSAKNIAKSLGALRARGVAAAVGAPR